MRVINNWRAAHSFPLNTFKMTLRNKALSVDARAMVAQRLKRLSSIELKLRQYRGRFTLHEMQDIGGCRAIVSSTRQVDELVGLYRDSRLEHELIDEDDYICNPKGTGYRGLHLIYRYHSDRSRRFNGRKIEMQLRSLAQHIWATAVETVGTFTDQPLKSGGGSRDWRRFFALMGTEMALRERTPPIPGTPTERTQLVSELRELAARLDVEARLEAYGGVESVLPRPKPKDRYFLLVLDSRLRRVSVRAYPQMELELASRDLSETENAIKGNQNMDAVLVSVESVASLRRAYPNYFMDTRRFLEAVRRAIRSGGRPAASAASGLPVISAPGV